MRILSSLKNFTADCSGKNGVVTVSIAGLNGGRIVLFDSAVHGYDAMFCNARNCILADGGAVAWEQVMNVGGKWIEFAEEEPA